MLRYLKLFYLGLSGLAAASAWALNPSLPPSGNFDLTHWNLTIPVDKNGTNVGVAIQISNAQLRSGYTNAAYFYTGPDGAMVFWCPVDGATTSGSSYPRSELRELVNTNNDNDNWDPGVGTHTMDAQCKVTQAPGTGKTIIGQIHGFSGAAYPMIKLQFQNGSINALYKQDPTSDTDTTLTFPNPGLNQLITYEIQVVGPNLNLTVNGITQVGDVHLWAGQSCYFKAGDYCQDNTGTSPEGAGVSFYSLTVVHGSGAPSAPSINTQPTNQTVTAGQNATFNVNAGGTSPLNYQWYFNTNTALASATNAALTLNVVQATNAGAYSVIITNSIGSVTSSVAMLTVKPPASGSGTNVLVWDADSGTAGIQDGSGMWSTANVNWSADGNGDDDAAWVQGSSAVFGGGASGTAGTVSFSSVTVSNLTFNPANAGNYTIGSSSSILTLTGSPTITVNSGGDATLLANLAGTGYTKAGGGTLTLTTSGSTMNTFSGGVTVQAGTLAAGGNSSKPVISSGGLTINSGAVFAIASSKSGLITSGASVTNLGGTFIAGGTETIGNLVLGDNGVITNGSTSSRTFTVTNVIILQSGSIAYNPNPAKLVLGGAASLVKTTSGTVYILGTTSSQVANTFTGKSMISGGILNLGLDAALGPNPGSFTPDQLLLDGGALQITNAYTWGSKRGVTLTANGGTFDIGTGVPQTIPVVIAGAANGGLTKVGAGSLTLSATNSYNGNTVVSNGVLVLLKSAAISNSPVIQLAGGATLDVSAAGLLLGSSQTLAGSGTVSGNVVMTAGARIQPGTNALKLTVSGNLTLNSNRVVVDLGGGTLAAGSYRLLDYSGSRTGLFNPAPIILNGSVAGTATIDQSATNQINLTVTGAAAPPPSFDNVVMSGSNLIMAGSGGTAAGIYYVLTSTNLALAMTNWPRIATNTFDASGHFSFTNVLEPAQAGQFFQIMTP